MKGPYGLNDVDFSSRPEGGPLRTDVRIFERTEGLAYAEVYVYEQGHTPNAGPIRSAALCVFVEGDKETLREAMQWLLDMTALRAAVPAGSR